TARRGVLVVAEGRDARPAAQPGRVQGRDAQPRLLRCGTRSLIMRILATTLRLLTFVAVILLAGTGLAQAYWLTLGSGSGSASADTMTISAEASSAEPLNGTLYPGGTADAVLKLRNPNSFGVRVTAITATGVPQAANNCSPVGVSF